MNLSHLFRTVCVAGLFSLAAPALFAYADEKAPQARIDNARTFPWFAAGAGWESTISLVNMAEDTEVGFRLNFYGLNGQPARLTVRDSSNRTTSAESYEGRLRDDGGETLVLVDGGALQTGWISLTYDGDNRIAGALYFRQRVAGRPDFEASVSLTRDDERLFWMPFDNTNGYVTTLAVTNPSTSDATNVRVRFWDLAGQQILDRELRLGAAVTTGFVLQDQFPELAGRAGVARIEGSGPRLSAIALRANPTGPITAVPITSR